MSDAGRKVRADDVVRAEAIAWLAALRSPQSEGQHKAFEDWYATDPRHADIYDEVVGNWQTMVLAAQTPAADASARPAARSNPRSPMKWAIAAIAVLALVLLTGIGFTTSGVGVPNTAGRTTIASGIGEIGTVLLDDGSRVTLDTGTILAVAYNAGERRLTLERGRARFDVAHNSDRPFVVAAGGGAVIAHGTLFDVSLLGPRVTVALLRGSVEVRTSSSRAGGNSSAGRLLVPGQQIAFKLGAAIGAMAALRDSETQWPAGMLWFDDATLREVVAAANRYNKKQIILADPGAAGLRFTGSLAVRDAGGLARMLAATFALDLSRSNHGGLILATRARQKKIPG